MSESKTLLTIDDQPISFKQALKYLRASGKLQSVLSHITQQYLVEAELQRFEINLDGEEIEQAIIDWRLREQLEDAEQFKSWLMQEGLNYQSFRDQVGYELQRNYLKSQIVTPKLRDYFISQKLNLDQVVLSRIVVATKEVAEDLKLQILEDGRPFEELAQEYSEAKDRDQKGWMGEVSRGRLPDHLRAEVDQAQIGDLMGPLEIDNAWYLLRIEGFKEAVLNASVQSRLEQELFDQWLLTKMQNTTVTLQVDI